MGVLSMTLGCDDEGNVVPIGDSTPASVNDPTMVCLFPCNTVLTASNGWRIQSVMQEPKLEPPKPEDGYAA
jgi:hypothetical protein